MSEHFEMIKAALDDAVGKSLDFNLDTHLIEDGILDSLDSAVFLLNVEKASGVKLSEDSVEKKDLYKVSNLIAFIESNGSR